MFKITILEITTTRKGNQNHFLLFISVLCDVQYNYFCINEDIRYNRYLHSITYMGDVHSHAQS